MSCGVLENISTRKLHEAEPVRDHAGYVSFFIVRLGEIALKLRRPERETANDRLSRLNSVLVASSASLFVVVE